MKARSFSFTFSKSVANVVWDPLGRQVQGQVEEHVWEQITVQVWKQVWEQIRDQLAQ